MTQISRPIVWKGEKRESGREEIGLFAGIGHKEMRMKIKN